MTLDEVEVTVKLKFNVYVGGAYEKPLYPGQHPGKEGLYYGPTTKEAVENFLTELTQRTSGIFFKNTEVLAEVLEVSEIKTNHSTYMSGE